VITLKTEKEPKMKFFDFGAFQKIMKMLSREKYIFHMLFGASHGTPRITLPRYGCPEKFLAIFTL